MANINTIENKNNKQDQDASSKKQELPKSLFGLFIYILKNIFSPKHLIRRIIIALITGVLILILHTYMLVVLNEGFGAGTNKFLNYIIAVDVGGETPAQRNLRMLNVNLFWGLLSCLFWGTIARLRLSGLKLYILSVLNGIMRLIQDFFEKPGSFGLSVFLGGIIFGFAVGVFVLNPFTAILLAVLIFLSVTARQGSFVILVTYLAWGDYQRFFNINPRKAFYIDLVSCALRGGSLGLILYSVFPLATKGDFAKYACLFFIVCLLILNMRIKTSKTASAIFFALSSVMLFSAVKAYADDGGWSESGGNLNGWLKSGGADEAVKRGNGPLSWWVSMALGFVPWVGDAKDYQEMSTGVDLITGEKLAPWERMITAGATIVPIVSGKLVREGVKGTGKAIHGIGEALGILGKHEDEVKKVIKEGAEVIEKVDDVSDASKKASQVLENKAKGDAFEKVVKQEIEKTQRDVVEQITVKTESGVKTKLDLLGIDKKAGDVKITESKSSLTAPLTKNQKKAFPEIEQKGATVVGKGKPPFKGGTKIPPTKVDIVRPKE
ncbi:MAG: pre-toxin TG domain-containing protein [Deltaproteobacteria bacterium]